MERAYEELNRFTWNEEEILTYDQAEKYEGAFQASMAQKFDEGVAKGIEKGIEKGMAKGIAKGMAKGIAKTNFEIARKMVLDGVSVETISKFTGLSEKEINSLIEKS
jgi:predicted transposase/invertase (TIGR01784 family)